MDIDEVGKPLPGHADSDTESRQIVLPGEALPPAIAVLAQDHRPFFPGQAVPLLLSSDVWLSTLESVRQRKQEVVGVIATRHALEGLPGPADCFEVGTVCRIHRVHREGEQLQVLLEGLQRFEVRRWLTQTLPLSAQVHYLLQPTDSTPEVKAYAVAIINIIKELIPLNPLYGEELKLFLQRSSPNEPSLLADFAANLTTASKEDLQAVLEAVALLPRLERVVKLLQREVQIASAQMEIREHVEKEIQGHQREAFLRQQLKFIQQELGITKDDKTAEIDEFKARLAALTVPAAAATRIDEELKKLGMLELGSPEYGVTRNYLDWLTSVPWGRHSSDNVDLARARATLDAHHEGLDDIKSRILEFLAIGIQKGDAAGSIICFVGPPGVGKTSLGRAIAEALGREFYRFSVGGMRDEAEIKGHRRTYIGAMPGKLIQALKDTGVANPVIMLDEVDKIGASYQGDPASALLEVLDPEQNGAFRDHYLDVEVDLSRVLFICTANQLDTIPAALLDRMEVIALSGYLDAEKLAIARRHLLPRQLQRAGLRQRGDLRIDTTALKQLITGYAREAGVRRLDKTLASIVRKAVVEMLEGKNKPIHVTPKNVEHYLGAPLYTDEAVLKGIGIITGLAWTAAGGATLPIEATAVHRRGADFKLSGQLGDVMRESAGIAYSHVAGNAQALGSDPEFFASASIHLHVPAGATPKDGPSAGIAMASALLSLAKGKATRRAWAMTGELTLTGRVYPVGGIREKLLAARRQRLKHILLPAANERDLRELPESVVRGLDVQFVDHFSDVAALLFPD